MRGAERDKHHAAFGLQSEIEEIAGGDEGRELGKDMKEGKRRWKMSCCLQGKICGGGGGGGGRRT